MVESTGTARGTSAAPVLAVVNGCIGLKHFVDNQSA